MKYFHYAVQNDEIKELKGVVEAIPQGFRQYKTSMMGVGVYYVLHNGHVTDVIGEGWSEPIAHQRADEFLSGFNVSLV